MSPLQPLNRNRWTRQNAAAIGRKEERMPFMDALPSCSGIAACIDQSKSNTTLNHQR
jgi:hypothetical protein